MRMKTLACCRRRPQDFSIDMDQEPDRVMTYNGLETCIINSSTYDDDSGISATTGGDGCVTTDSLDDEVSSCSSKDASGSSFSSHCLSKQEEHSLDELGTPIAVHLLPFKGKKPVTYTLSASDIEIMKEKFAKLLLGDDTSGGARGVCTALALSNGIINLSATVFGELWKLEPLCEEKKIRWRKEMDWLLSPTTYMVELVPTKQSGADGCTFEIMTPKARSDVHVNLPALQKLDAMLIEVMDSMIDTEFWYEESGSRADGRGKSTGPRKSKKWWLPSPRVPEQGLSQFQRKRLVFQAKLVHQILKAAKSINEQVLFHMSGRASLGEDLYQAITTEYIPIEEIFVSLSLKTEHSVLETINRLEGAVFAWNQRISEERCKKSPGRHSWNFMKDSSSELDKMSACIERVDTLVQLLKSRFPNMPPTFIDVLKVQYNVVSSAVHYDILTLIGLKLCKSEHGLKNDYCMQDVGHAIVEAYSRALVGVAFSILSRVADILLEDDLIKKPNTPMATLKFDLSSDVYLAGITETPPGHIRRSLMDQISMVDGRLDAVVIGKKKGVKQLRW
ncbi:Rop guanine nucleotide exchange factor 14 [Dichanthelium oligosanthes]|uniref:Rop guanine nucleotide exchange factor 14 n=1 Tax=Dichanthelium oligosanthes TaxID=888268 RepID=A0A1E5W746_9POAL|nr:Rop guanine nucleotide exchange factor 14 [Dichanthelium oligosanthes]